jgi:hypothetical protein
MYDALLQTRREEMTHPYALPFVLVTIHRAENTDVPEKFAGIWTGWSSCRTRSRSCSGAPAKRGTGFLTSCIDAPPNSPSSSR